MATTDTVKTTTDVIVAITTAKSTTTKIPVAETIATRATPITTTPFAWWDPTSTTKATASTPSPTTPKGDNFHSRSNTNDLRFRNDIFNLPDDEFDDLFEDEDESGGGLFDGLSPLVMALAGGAGLVVVLTVVSLIFICRKSPGRKSIYAFDNETSAEYNDGNGQDPEENPMRVQMSLLDNEYYGNEQDSGERIVSANGNGAPNFQEGGRRTSGAGRGIMFQTSFESFE